jgi:hypothetical protein
MLLRIGRIDSFLDNLQIIHNSIERANKSAIRGKLKRSLPTFATHYTFPHPCQYILCDIGIFATIFAYHRIFKYFAF